MKKVYYAPKIYIEQFELTEHIAACGTTTQGNPNNFGKPNARNIVDCEFVSHDGFTKVFWNDNNSECNFEYSDSYASQIGCYNTPTGENIIFAS